MTEEDFVKACKIKLHSIEREAFKIFTKTHNALTHVLNFKLPLQNNVLSEKALIFPH